MSVFYFLFFFVVPALSIDHLFFWNVSNPIWQSDDPTLTVRIGDRIRLHCPEVRDGEPFVPLRVYQVSEFSAAECILETGKRQVLLCNGSGPSSTVVIVRSFSATPQALTFQPLNSYYWISTSTGRENGLDRQMGGLCKTNNMRLRVDIAEGFSETTRRPTTEMTTRQTTTTTEPMTTTTAPPRAHYYPVHHPPARSIPEQKFLSENLNEKHFSEVADMARRGRTGTFRHDELEDKNEKGNTWDPVTIDIYNKGLYNSENALYDSVGPDEVTFEVHEDGSQLYARSYPYQAGACSFLSLVVCCLSFLLCFW